MADPSRPTRPPPHRPPGTRPGLLRRFSRAQKGATAVEFAFIAIPFFTLIFAIFELGLVFLVSITLEKALMTADRKIRTGEFKIGDKQTFLTTVCGQMPVPMDSCLSAISLDVRVMPSFSDVDGLEHPLPGKTCWNPGGANSVILVRGYYKWPIITPLLQDAVGGSGGDREISYAAAFRNEPYDNVVPPEVKCSDDP